MNCPFKFQKHCLQQLRTERKLLAFYFYSNILEGPTWTPVDHGNFKEISEEPQFRFVKLHYPNRALAEKYQEYNKAAHESAKLALKLFQHNKFPINEEFQENMVEYSNLCKLVNDLTIPGVPEQRSSSTSTSVIGNESASISIPIAKRRRVHLASPQSLQLYEREEHVRKRNIIIVDPHAIHDFVEIEDYEFGLRGSEMKDILAVKPCIGDPLKCSCVKHCANTVVNNNIFSFRNSN